MSNKDFLAALEGIASASHSLQQLHTTMTTLKTSADGIFKMMKDDLAYATKTTEEGNKLFRTMQELCNMLETIEAESRGRMEQARNMTNALARDEAFTRKHGIKALRKIEELMRKDVEQLVAIGNSLSETKVCTSAIQNLARKPQVDSVVPITAGGLGFLAGCGVGWLAASEACGAAGTLVIFGTTITGGWLLLAVAIGGLIGAGIGALVGWGIDAYRRKRLDDNLNTVIKTLTKVEEKIHEVKSRLDPLRKLVREGASIAESTAGSLEFFELSENNFWSESQPVLAEAAMAFGQLCEQMQPQKSGWGLWASAGTGFVAGAGVGLTAAAATMPK